MAVFFPVAEYQVTTRVTSVKEFKFRSEGKVLVKPGWLAIYGKEAQDEDSDDNGSPWWPCSPVKPCALMRPTPGPQDPPPARYSEATLLSAMEGAGKLD